MSSGSRFKKSEGQEAVSEYSWIKLLVSGVDKDVDVAEAGWEIKTTGLGRSRCLYR